MAINLKKGQKIDLTKPGDQGLRAVRVGLGWDAVKKGGFFSRKTQDVDCDASVILCGEDGKLVSKNTQENLVYFGNLIHPSGAIIHAGDNLTGDGDGDDEQITVDLTKVPGHVAKMVFVVNIYDGTARNQHFGMIQNAFIHLIDLDKGNEICRFDLTENYDQMTGLIVGEIYRHNGGWKFNAIGQPVRTADRLSQLLDYYS